jgi:hypothetical protein
MNEINTKTNEITKTATGDMAITNPAKKTHAASKTPKAVMAPKFHKAKPPTASMVPKVTKAMKQVKKSVKATTTAPKTSKVKINVKASKYSRNAKNPFRPGSSYASCFDIMASFGKKGCAKGQLVELMAKERKTDLKHAYYDCAVLLSAKESNKSPRHRSCRFGFWIKRKDDHITLMVD